MYDLVTLRQRLQALNNRNPNRPGASTRPRPTVAAFQPGAPRAGGAFVPGTRGSFTGAGGVAPPMGSSRPSTGAAPSSGSAFQNTTPPRQGLQPVGENPDLPGNPRTYAYGAMTGMGIRADWTDAQKAAARQAQEEVRGLKEGLKRPIHDAYKAEGSAAKLLEGPARRAAADAAREKYRQAVQAAGYSNARGGGWNSNAAQWAAYRRILGL